VIVYLWTTVARETPMPHGYLGVSDDDGRARGAAEHCLRTGQARLAFVETAQTVMAAHSLSMCYLRTGAGWWARPGPAGEVHWVTFTGSEVGPFSLDRAFPVWSARRRHCPEMTDNTRLGAAQASAAEPTDEDTGREPGAPVRMMAQILAERGFEVRCREHGGNRVLDITGTGKARCQISAQDGDSDVVWEYVPSSGSRPRAADASRMVLCLLGGDQGEPAELYAHLHRGARLKGAVAREMHARGLKADLEVTEDTELYDVAAEVVLTNPAKPERGVVLLCDEGIIRWECDYATIPQHAAAIADTTAEVLTAAWHAGDAHPAPDDNG
jgi:hypothetical protein